MSRTFHNLLRGGALLASLLAIGACSDREITEPRAEAPAIRGNVTVALPSVNVVALIDTIDNSIIEDSTGAYDIPTAAQTDDFRAAVDSVLAGSIAGADTLLAQYGYDVYRIQEAVTGDTLVVFRERRPKGQDVPRGWGTYIYNTSSTARRADIHANHPISDQHTEDIAADLYQRCRCRWLFVAGAERDANHLDPDLSSDMARATNSVFHQMFTRVAAADVRTLSIHGFRHSNNPGLPAGVDHVLSVGGRFFLDTAQAYTIDHTTLRTRLVNQSFVAGLYNLDPSYDDLGATVNPQGQHSNNSFGFGAWLSVETERNVRESLPLRDTMNAVLSQWIADFPA